MRNVVAALLFIAFGFLFLTAELTSFTHPNLAHLKWGTLLALFHTIALALWGALELTEFDNWQVNTALTLLVPSTMTVLGILWLVGAYTSEATNHMINPQLFSTYGDLTSGFGVLFSVAVIGIGLLLWRFFKS